MANHSKFTPLADPAPIVQRNIEELRRQGTSDVLIAITLGIRKPEDWGLVIPKPKTRNTSPRDAAPKPIRVTTRAAKVLLEQRTERLRLAREEFERVKATGEPTTLTNVARDIGVDPSYFWWRIHRSKDRTFIDFHREITRWNQSLEQRP
jgi:hypothetical protein